jgi:hypothetical protein
MISYGFLLHATAHQPGAKIETGCKLLQLDSACLVWFHVLCLCWLLCVGRTVLDPAAAGGNKNAKAMFGKDELAAILRYGCLAMKSM